MIRYRLICKKSHEFETWFQNSEAFDGQVQRGHVACPNCGSIEVRKALMAPSVKTSKTKARPKVAARAAAAAALPSPDAAPSTPQIAAVSPKQRELITMIRDLRKKVLENTEYVGNKFAEEARKIHYNEAESRGISGEATLKEAKNLIDEGIEIIPLPDLPSDHN